MPKLKFVFKIYIIGLFASMIATILPIVALALPEWGTVHTKDVQGNIGLFRYCCKICDGEEVCGDPADVVRDRLVHHGFFYGADDEQRMIYLNACRATVILGMIFTFGSLVFNLVANFKWLRDRLPRVLNDKRILYFIAGTVSILGGLSHLAAVIMYGEKIHKIHFTHGAGFYIDICALVSTCIAGTLFFFVFAYKKAPEGREGNRMVFIRPVYIARAREPLTPTHLEQVHREAHEITDLNRAEDAAEIEVLNP